MHSATGTLFPSLLFPGAPTARAAPAAAAGPLTLGVTCRGWQGAGREPEGDADELTAPLLMHQPELRKSALPELPGAGLFASNPV